MIVKFRKLLPTTIVTALLLVGCSQQAEPEPVSEPAPTVEEVTDPSTSNVEDLIREKLEQKTSPQTLEEALALLNLTDHLADWEYKLIDDSNYYTKTDYTGDGSELRAATEAIWDNVVEAFNQEYGEDNYTVKDGMPDHEFIHRMISTYGMTVIVTYTAENVFAGDVVEPHSAVLVGYYDTSQ